jgi:hypothetical protein
VLLERLQHRLGVECERAAGGQNGPKRVTKGLIVSHPSMSHKATHNCLPPPMPVLAWSNLPAWSTPSLIEIVDQVEAETIRLAIELADRDAA